MCGKMFGVLVVKNRQRDLGYLAAFSGKLAGENYLEGFVGPIYDRLEKKGFFKEEEELIIAINEKIKAIELDPYYLSLLSDFDGRKYENTREIRASLINKKKAKYLRRIKREIAKKNLSGNNLEFFLEKMSKESQDLHFQHKRKLQTLRAELIPIEESLAFFQKKLSLIHI